MRSVIHAAPSMRGRFGRQSSCIEQAPQRLASKTGAGRVPVVHGGARLLRHCQREIAQFGIKRNDLAPSRRSVKQRTLGYGLPGHVFQAEPLRAKLDLVSAMGLRSAALVFDGIGDRAAHLDHIGHTVQAMLERGDLDRAKNAQTIPAFGPARVSAFMQNAAFRSEPVLCPDPFDMDQRTLPRAEQPVLQRR